jgi:hypothetical protein
MTCGKCPACGSYMHKCPQCNGTGRKGGYSCKHCGGTGCICPHRHESKGGCFITTAAILALGKRDDCEELTAFRAFRDNWLLNQVNGHRLINEYYEIAPVIVNCIDSMLDSSEMYLAIWTKNLEPCYRLIQQDKNVEAYEQYKKMMEELKDKYLK